MYTLGSTNRLKGGEYKHRGMSSRVERKMALYNIILPMEYGANDAVILGPL
jgi:hypothetical protein